MAILARHNKLVNILLFSISVSVGKSAVCTWTRDQVGIKGAPTLIATCVITLVTDILLNLSLFK